MSQWHARAGIPDGNAYTIVFHVPIPSVNNRVNVNYRTALVGSGIGGTTQMAEGNNPGQITTVEKASVLSGALYEYSEVIHTNPGETVGQLAARVDSRYADLANVNGEFLRDLRRRLDYWGGASTN